MDYMDLVIPEHRTRPKFAAWVKSALDPVQSAQDLLNALPAQYDIDHAVGIQLDRIGDILGRPRRLPFQPSEGVSPIMDDNNYRLVLKATIISEHFDGTIPNLYNLFQTVLGDTGLYFIIIDNQDMTVSIIIFGRTTSLIKDELEKGLIVPRPEGVGTTINVTSNQIFSWGFDTHSLSEGTLANPEDMPAPIDTPAEFDVAPHTLVLAFSVSGNTAETGSGDKAPDNPYELSGATSMTISDGGSQTQTITFPQALYGLPSGVADEWDVMNGTGTQKIQNRALDGSEDWTFGASADGFLRIFLAATDTAGTDYDAINCVSNRFASISRNQGGTTEGISVDGTRIQITISTARLPGWSDGSKNLFDAAQTPTSLNAATLSDAVAGGFTVTATGSQGAATYKLNLKAGTQYCIFATSTRTAESGGGIAVYDSAGTTILAGDASTLSPSLTFTAPDDGIVNLVFYATDADTSGSATFSQIQLEEGTAATEYVDYAAPWTDGQKVEALKAWLAANPVTVLYEAAEPQAISGTARPVSVYQHNVVTSDGGGRIAGIRLGNDVFSGWGTGYWLPIRSV